MALGFTGEIQSSDKPLESCPIFYGRGQIYASVINLKFWSPQIFNSLLSALLKYQSVIINQSILIRRLYSIVNFQSTKERRTLL